jgi:hypothetical protein
VSRPALRLADHWYGFPRTLRIGVITAVWFGYAILVLDLNALDSGSRSVKFIWVACLVWAALSVLADLGVRSRFSSSEQRRTYVAALRTGELPATHDRDEWRRWLGRGTMWHAIAPCVWGPPLWLGVFSSLSSQSTYGQVTVWPFVLLSVVGGIAYWRRHLQIVRLRAAMKRGVTVAAFQARAAETPEETWVRMPAAARLFGSAAGGFGIASLALLLADLDSVVFGGALIEHLERAGALAAPMSLVSAISLFGDPSMRRGGGPVEPLVEYERAVRTGELPLRIEPGVWRGWLRRSRWFYGIGVLWPCFFAAVGGWAIVTEPTGYHWVVAMLLQLLAIRLGLNWWRTRVRLAQLAAGVDRQAMRQSWG